MWEQILLQDWQMDERPDQVRKHGNEPDKPTCTSERMKQSAYITSLVDKSKASMEDEIRCGIVEVPSKPLLAS